MGDLRGSWLNNAVDSVGARTTQQGDEAAAYYIAQSRQQQADGAAELARWSGLPVDTVNRNAAEVARDRRVQTDVGTIRSQPGLQSWLTQPNNAAAAQGDIENLGAASAWFGPAAVRDQMRLMNNGVPAYERPSLLAPRSSAEVLRSARAASAREADRVASIETNRPDPTPYTLFRGISVDTAEGLRQSWLGAEMFMADAVGAQNLIPGFNAQYQQSLERAQAYRPQIGTGVGSSIYGGVTSLLQTLPALAAAPFTDGTSLLTIFGLQTGTQAYGKYRARGATANEAAVGGGLEGTIEGVTEALPIHFLLGNFGRRGTAGFISGFLGRELVGEEFATLGQDAVDTAIANPTATWSQYWADRPRAIFDTAVATVIASGAIGGAHRLARNILEPVHELDAATTALAGAHFLDQAIAIAEASNLHKQDPEGFRQFIEHQSQGTPVDHVYLPGEAVRSLMQSEGVDYHTDPFWAPFANQIDNAAAIGGDVVMPIADAVTGFAHNKQWDTLRDSARLSPGGISRAEAMSIAQSYQSIMEDRGSAAAAEARASAEEQAPVRKVYDAVLSQVRSAGMSLNSSRAYADLFAARYAARAEQRGTDAWSLFQESLGGITGETPSSLRPYETADQLDVLVNAMRRGKAAPSDAKVLGPSLLEFVAARGGVTDPQGDLASMGADKWHQAQPFRKRLVRPSEGGEVLPGMEVQGNANSPDAMAQAAWEAGYFPNATERPTVDDFLQAVDSELRGSPIHAEHEGGQSNLAADVAMRGAAEDLRGFLENRGIDPDTAPIADIREAIAAHESVSARGLEQTDAMRVWSEPPPGMAPEILHHNGPVDLPRGKPSGPVANYFGTRDFADAVGRDFGDWRYTYWVPQAVTDKIVTLEPSDAQGREVAAAIAERQWPDEPAYADGLRSGDEDAWLDFYETWADSANVAPALTELGFLGARHKAETMMLPEGVAQLVDRRSGPDDGTVSFYQSQPEHPPFFSALRRAADAAGTAKAPAAQWLATFRNAPGVKAEEIEWSGLEEWLAEQPGAVSRTDVQEFLKSGGIAVDEVVLGDFDSRAISELAEQLMDGAVATRVQEIMEEEADPWAADPSDYVEAVTEVEEGGEVVAWEFDGIEFETEDQANDARDDYVARQQQLQENERARQIEEAVRDKMDEDAFHEMAVSQLGALGHYPDWTSAGERDAAQAQNYRELLITLPLGQGRNPREAPDTHWQQPGVIAHLRFLTRRGLDGKPVLFIEEVQSDWHQKGRDEGYAKPATAAEILKAQEGLQSANERQRKAFTALVDLARELGAFPAEGQDAPPGAAWWADYVNAPLAEKAGIANQRLRRIELELAQSEVASEEFEKILREGGRPSGVAAQIAEARAETGAAALLVSEATQAYARATSTAGIPEAPFKTTWPALVMKRAIRWAADNGFTRVAWTTGDQQNERYSLDMHLGGSVSIRYGEMGKDQHYVVVPGNDVAEDAIIDKFGLEAHGGANGRGMVMTAEQVREVFGTGLGEKMLAAVEDPDAIDHSVGTLEERGSWAVLRGADLSIGGEGMRAFYDRNLVNITNDLIKRYGSRVSKVQVRDSQLEAMRQQLYLAENELAIEQALADRGGGDFRRLGQFKASVETWKERIAQAADTGEEQWGFDVTPKMADAARAGFSLFQGGEDKPRGRIDFDKDNKAIIRLFEGHDLSTVIHEGGHLWLEELRADALRADATDAAKADWEIVHAWFKANGHRVTSGGAIPTDAHEMWARAFERYAMEGKAPSSALRRAFSNFRGWLLRIYKVVTNLNTPLTDEVRGVMDRMLATQEQIDEMSQKAESAFLFKTAEEAGMTPEEFAAYRGTVEEARTAAFDALLYRTMEVIRREKTAAWKRESKGVRDEIEKQVKARPEFRALALLRGVGGERVQLNRAALVGEWGSDILAMLPRGVPPTIVEQGGVHPQILAEQSGFRTADEMLNMLAGVEQRQRELKASGDRRSVQRETIDLGTQGAMRERHGDPLNDGSIEEEALAAIHNDQRAEVISSEMRALARRSNRAGYQVATPWRTAKDWADRVVREGTISEQASAAALARHRRNEAKAGKAAEAALVAGNVDEAFRQKQSQLHHHALYRAAKEAKDQIDVAVKRLGKYARSRGMPSIDPDYFDRISQLLEAYDFRPRTGPERKERTSFAVWAEAQAEAGAEVYVPPRLRDAGVLNFKDATVADIIGVDDAVQSLAYLGRKKNKLRAAGEERDLEEVVGEALAGADSLKPRRLTSDRNEPNDWRARMRGIDSLLVKMEFLADHLDQNNPNGAHNRVLVRGATEAANEKDRLVKEVLKPLVDLYNAMSPAQQRRQRQKVVVPELVTRNPETGVEGATTFERSEILAIALNTGNESNLSKLLRGESRGVSDAHAWTIEKLQAVLDRELNEEDWQFVQAVWDRIETLWPAIVRSERELTGLTPEKVVPRIVQTKFGSVRGGYYPVVFDSTRSTMAEANYEDDAAKLLGQTGRVVGTPKGHTITRTEAAAPLLLSLEGVLMNHVNRVTTRIAYGRFVRDVLRFTSHPKIKALWNRKLGPEYHKLIKPWLHRQISDAALDTRTLSALDRELRHFRINATMVGLGFRATTMAAQVAGLTNSTAEIGPKWVAVGVAEATRNMGHVREFVFSRSPEMSVRVQSFDRDIRAFFSEMHGHQGALANARAKLDPIRAAAFWGIGNVQLFMVDLPTWLGAYHKAMSEGMTEDEAVAYGDKIVRRSQGAGRAKDLSAIQDSSEGYRILTMFYSWFNILYNKQRETIHSARNGDYRRAAANVVWLMMAAPIAAALLTGDWPVDDDGTGHPESWGRWAIRKMFFGLWMGIPAVRDAASEVERKVSNQYTSPTTTPIVRAFEEIQTPIMDAIHAARGKPYSDRWLQHAITAPGYFVGLPTGQVGQTSQYLYDLRQGTQHPQGVTDVIAGMSRGPRPSQAVAHPAPQ